MKRIMMLVALVACAFLVGCQADEQDYTSTPATFLLSCDTTKLAAANDSLRERVVALEAQNESLREQDGGPEASFLLGAIERTQQKLRLAQDQVLLLQEDTALMAIAIEALEYELQRSRRQAKKSLGYAQTALELCQVQARWDSVRLEEEKKNAEIARLTYQLERADKKAAMIIAESAMDDIDFLLDSLKRISADREEIVPTIPVEFRFGYGLGGSQNFNYKEPSDTFKLSHFYKASLAVGDYQSNGIILHADGIGAQGWGSNAEGQFVLGSAGGSLNLYSPKYKIAGQAGLQALGLGTWPRSTFTGSAGLEGRLGFILHDHDSKWSFTASKVLTGRTFNGAGRPDGQLKGWRFQTELTQSLFGHPDLISGWLDFGHYDTYQEVEKGARWFALGASLKIVLAGKRQ